MATAILAPACQYRLPAADRQQILAGMPPEIKYPGGIVPDNLLQQNIQFFPKLAGRTKLSISEFHSIMCAEVALQQAIFVQNHGKMFG